MKGMRKGRRKENAWKNGTKIRREEGKMKEATEEDP